MYVPGGMARREGDGQAIADALARPPALHRIGAFDRHMVEVAEAARAVEVEEQLPARAAARPSNSKCVTSVGALAPAQRLRREIVAEHAQVLADARVERVRGWRRALPAGRTRSCRRSPAAARAGPRDCADPPSAPSTRARPRAMPHRSLVSPGSWTDVVALGGVVGRPVPDQVMGGRDQGAPLDVALVADLLEHGPGRRARPACRPADRRTSGRGTTARAGRAPG